MSYAKIEDLTADHAAYLIETVAPVAAATLEEAAGDSSPALEISKAGLEFLAGLDEDSDGHLDESGQIWIGGDVAGRVMGWTLPVRAAEGHRRPGRPSRGERVQVRLDADTLGRVQMQADDLAPDRSAYLARLVGAGLAAWDLIADDVAAIRIWASEWPDCCGVLLQRSGRSANILYADARGDLEEDVLHQVQLPERVAVASRRLVSLAPLVVALEVGHSDGDLGRLVIPLHAVVVGRARQRGILTAIRASRPGRRPELAGHAWRCALADSHPS